MSYRELDEMDYEYKHAGDVCWDEDIEEELYGCGDVDDEPVDFTKGVFGNELNQEKTAQNEPEYEYPSDVFHVAGEGRISGLGYGEDIALAVQSLLVNDRRYHFEFKFWKVPDEEKWTKCNHE